MKNIITFILLLFLFSCNKDYKKVSESILIAKNNTSIIVQNITIEEEPYHIKFILEPESNDEYILNIAMELNNESHFVSPNAKRDFSGKFYTSLINNEYFILNGELIETPRSVEEIDPHPFVGGAVNWVRVNTNYSQRIKLNTQEDFDFIGYVQFTIEPRCTLEKIEFIIKSRSGNLYFERFVC